MYRKQVKSEKLKVKSYGFRKSFTLIEVIVVMGVMGLIMGGLLVSLRQIIESESLLKKMQAMEEETRFIMDAFAQDAEYSELVSDYKPFLGEGDIYSDTISFNLVEIKSDVPSGGNLESSYTSYLQNESDYYFKRILTEQTDPPTSVASTLNNTPMASRPVFRVRLISVADELENYFITITLVYKIESRGKLIYVPIQTSAMSRTFEI